MTLGVVKGLVGPLYSPKVLYFHLICRKPAFRHPIPRISRIDFQNRVLEVQPAFLREMVDLGMYICIHLYYYTSEKYVRIGRESVGFQEKTTEPTNVP